jgi:hypothetical protein
VDSRGRCHLIELTISATVSALHGAFNRGHFWRPDVMKSMKAPLRGNSGGDRSLASKRAGQQMMSVKRIS